MSQDKLIGDLVCLCGTKKTEAANPVLFVELKAKEEKICKMWKRKIHCATCGETVYLLDNREAIIEDMALNLAALILMPKDPQKRVGELFDEYYQKMFPEED